MNRCLYLNRLQKHLMKHCLFDSIALALAVLPALFVYPAILTGPAVFYLAIRYWKRPSSIIPRSKWRFVVALLFASAELGMFALVIFAFFQLRSSSGTVQK